MQNYQHYTSYCSVIHIFPNPTPNQKVGPMFPGEPPFYNTHTSDQRSSHAFHIICSKTMLLRPKALIQCFLGS